MGKIIVYGNRSSAMDAVLFSGVPKAKNEARESKIKDDGSVKSFKSAPKGTPSDKLPRVNVKSKPQQKNALTPEEADARARTKTLYNVLNVLKDLGDSAARSDVGYVADFTEVLRPDGSEIVLKIAQDESKDPSAIVVTEKDDYLMEYLAERGDPREARRVIYALVGSFRSFDFSLEFDGKRLYAFGDKGDVVRIKWAMVNLLSRIYDEVEDESF